eukprot:TRINITY_DN5408_c0_g2_i2.p2 TRINITY_DN5408_c0_g2~~TRINITY_DN5408_c0_g2_i2.p2  ORF type:complete len:292 (-),score=58.52 TRINITY_DN5408_c0_g2_i2:723-1598(-)
MSSCTSQSPIACSAIYEELILVAQSYEANGGLYPQLDVHPKQRPVYFAKISFTHMTKRVFEYYEFEQVPNLLITNPKMLTLEEDVLKNIYMRDNLWFMTRTDGLIDARRILDYVNKRTGRNVPYQEPIYNFLVNIGFLLVGVAILYKFVMVFKKILLNKKTWLLGCLIIYIVCLGGFVYNTVNGVPFIGVDEDGQVYWVHNGGGYQLGIEGYAMSVLITIGGLLWVGFKKIAKMQDRTMARVYCLILMAAIWFVIEFLQYMYKRKGWYETPFWPNDYYIRGPLMRDQGNTV